MWGPPGGYPGGVPPAGYPGGIPPAGGMPPPGGIPPAGYPGQYGAFPPPAASPYPPQARMTFPPAGGGYYPPAHPQGPYPPMDQGRASFPGQQPYSATQPSLSPQPPASQPTFSPTPPQASFSATQGSFAAPPPQVHTGVPPQPYPSSTASSASFPAVVAPAMNSSYSGAPPMNSSYSSVSPSMGSSYSAGAPPGGSSYPPGAPPATSSHSSAAHQDQQRCLLIVKVHKARNLKWGGASRVLGFTRVRPFVSVMCEEIKLGNTGVASAKDTEPVWNETFLGMTSSFLPDTPPSSWVTITVRDYSDLRTSDVGSVSFQPTKAAGPESYTPEWQELTRKKGKGEILVSAVSVPMDEALKWMQTPSADFPLRRGCNVRLYQDAQCPSLLPHLPPRNCFEDIYASIQNAKRFIYITGWSVWTKLQLLRNQPVPLLGDLLKEKASQGVQVCIIIWDEFTSFESKKKGETEASSGLMNTFDEETRSFFKNSGVTLQALFRSGHQRIEEVYFTHHQKTVILDEGMKVVAYVGGLDLTNGRWDTPDHHLFASLQREHKDDWYQGCVATATPETGPRQPWHDIHSRVDGEIALDVFENFRQRWNHNPTNPNTTWGEFHDSARAQKWVPPPALLDVQNEYPRGGGGPEGTWSCQLLRSIDSYSIDFSLDNSRIIRSIHNSYVLRIATAQRYIYLENQYFMGSSHFWASKQDPGLRNLVPIAIVDKIISKIALGEDFCCYVIIPLFPEGDPETMGVKALLRWQYNTVKMMHKRIYDAIKLHKLSKNVEDYFVLMCLGKREDPNLAQLGGGGKTQHGSSVNGRQMVYVHSKMMIVDDEFILVGSANINDRSLRGNRDTEIAVICNQRGPTGAPQFSQEIADFRMSLWTEHFGTFNNVFMHPQSSACNYHIRQVADANWKCYENDAWSPETKIQGHACTYPYSTQVGEVSPPPGTGTFPDFKLAPIVGEVSMLPNQVTT